jgi:acyl-CoA synthetase (AMP-forming)/AMP-acid ligase II
MFMGSEIVTLPRFDPQSFWRAACDYKVNWTVTMPPVPAMLVEAVAARPKRHFLRETLGSGTPKDWNTFERVHGVDMSSGYGSTESTLVTISPSARVAGARLESPLSGSYCGSAIPGWSDVRITAEDTSPMAPDEPGDIQLRGGALFSRYWDNDAATRTAFTEDGWFRTGDIGYLNIAGDLYLMRRGDDRIRRNGENIDPAEIEAVIKEHPAVADVGVAGIPDARRGEEILACIVVVPGMAISQTEILTHCEKVLAKFKVPRYIEFRSHIPRTSATLRVQRTVLRQEANKQTWHDRFS